ncbi:General transcription factor IIH subunit 5 [Balamuthia mandrillaris]
MVNATEVVLLSCDPSLKQYLLLVDKEHHFIIKDLDETHLLVLPTATKFLQEKLDELHDENTYLPVEAQMNPS